MTSANITIDNTCLIKRQSDWYLLQQQNQGWAEVYADDYVCTVLSKLNATANTSMAHNNLKNKLQFGDDIYIISDIEFSKLPLPTILKLIKASYDKSKLGVYVALLSYYITPTTVDSTLPDSYKQSISELFDKEFSYATRSENLSIVEDNPINIINNNELVEGANFIFVHPNIRYFLWK